MELNEKQVMLIELRGNGESVTACAEALQVSRPTVYSWLEIEGMESLIRESSSEVVIRLGKRIVASLEKNLPIIEGIFSSKRSTNSEIIRSYSMLLGNARHLAEISDINQRLLILEGKK